jgi:hypothetical protein
MRQSTIQYMVKNSETCPEQEPTLIQIISLVWQQNENQSKFNSSNQKLVNTKIEKKNSYLTESSQSHWIFMIMCSYISVILMVSGIQLRGNIPVTNGKWLVLTTNRTYTIL